MPTAPAILIVDSNNRNVELLTAFLRESGYRTHGVAGIAELDELLTANRRPEIDLALVDLTGFDQAVWERCRRMHETGIAFVVIARARTPQAAQDLNTRSAGAGARHALTKPMRKDQLLTLIRILTGTGG